MHFPQHPNMWSPSQPSDHSSSSSSEPLPIPILHSQSLLCPPPRMSLPHLSKTSRSFGFFFYANEVNILD